MKLYCLHIHGYRNDYPFWCLEDVTGRKRLYEDLDDAIAAQWDIHEVSVLDPFRS